MALTKSLKEIIAEDKTGLLAKHESWQRVCIDNVALIVNGFPFESNRFHSSRGMPLVRIRDVTRGSTNTFYDGLFDEQYLIEAGDLLVGMDGDFNAARWSAQPALLNQRVCKIVPYEHMYSGQFLELALPGYLAAIHAATSSVTVKHLSSRSIGEIELPLPPFAEQSRIVDKLEELLSDLDAGVAELNAAQKKLAQYRQSLLKAAVEGRLTEGWRAKQGNAGPNEESGAQLLARILKERRARWEAKQLAKFEAQGKATSKGWQSKYPEPLALDSTSLPKLPHDWVWASLDMLIDEGPQNGLYLPSERYGRGCSILRIDDFQNGWVRARDELNLVDADAGTLATYSLIAGDVVVNRVNSMTHLGKTLVVNTVLGGALFESNMMRFSLHSAVNPQYVGAYLGSELGRKRLIRDAKWAVNQASINQQDVKRTPVPLAPCAAQEAVVDVVHRALSSSEEQLNAISHALRQSAAQRKNIFQSAFSGQLVPQDPNDEPASVLLARIRAERADRETTGARSRLKKKAVA